MSARISGVVCVAVGLALAGARADDKPFLHRVFGDNAVLQRDIELPVWGWTAPGAAVKVTLAGQAAETKAGADGKWSVRLPRLPAGGPHEMTVSGPQTVTVKNLLMGDVWICSGQSNMDWPVTAVNNKDEEIAAADFAQVRLFQVPKKIAVRPEEFCTGSWRVCSPTGLVEGGAFSAVGYFFGREVHKATQVPIGLIQSAWGGTIAEAWTSAEALAATPEFKPVIDGFLEKVAAQQAVKGTFEDAVRDWWKANDAGSAANPPWQDPVFEAAEWQTMTLPGAWEGKGLAGFDGVVWFRRTFDLPEECAGTTGLLALGNIDDRDTTWVNGLHVGSADAVGQPRRYALGKGVLKPGRNVIAVRVLDTGGGGGLVGKASEMMLRVECPGFEPVDLAGEWSYQAGKALAEMAPVPQRLDAHPNQPSVLYNGMIAPLLPFPIKGAIWYQGESNAGQPGLYQTLLPTLIADWRSRFKAGDFAFLIVQLANFTPKVAEPVQSGWAELREAQTMTVERVPRTGLAVAIDIGEANDIHPRNKQDVGKRLALAAQAIAYGQDKVVYSGPVFTEMAVEGDKARLSFGHIGGGLVVKGEKLTGFAVAGADGQFKHATAAVEGDTVVVSAEGVSEPKAVRYGWANNPDCNLYNREGLPAVPFRTDRK
ncbi:MAG: Glycosyl hydrolases family 2, sugar binding domain [Lentisphaerae bacterium ADurb.BinA184]|nr:MAG: Glycosyl hydrolases family 2, sugar binding domain [Lentisphaerae bacterium ADurb.BinA184]